MKNMNWIARGAALLLAILLAAGYAFLPEHETLFSENNSGRKKTEIPTEGELTWSWEPQLAKTDELTLALSGIKKAAGMTVYAAALDAQEQKVSSAAQAIDDLGEDAVVVLRGPFAKGTAYTLTLHAEGDGTIKVKGEEREDGSFYPQLRESGGGESRNMVVLYFALGFLMLALIPVRENRRVAKPAVQSARNWVDSLLPWGTFLLIAGVGILVGTHKPAFEPGIIWQSWDEEVHQGAVNAMTPLGVGSLQEWLGRMITWNPGYVPLALGQTVAGFFTSDYTVLYRAAVVTSSLVYAAMVALAVKHAPRYKATFLVAGTMPTLFYLMTSLSYDTVVTGSILLGIALAMESMERENISPLRAMTMIAILAFGTVAKPAYSLALIIPLFLPASSLGGKKQVWIFRVYVLLMLCWCMTALIVPGAYDTVKGGDARFAGVDPEAQVTFLLSSMENALKPARIAWESQNRLMNMGISHWAYLGNNDNWNALYLALLLWVAPLCAWGESWSRKSSLSWGRRLGLMLIAFGTELALVYTQYLISSEVGGDLDGMQARYFIPLWIATALAVMPPQGLRKRVDGRVSRLMTALVFITCCWVNISYAVGWLTSTGLLG